MGRIGKLVHRFNAAGYLTPGYTHVFVVPSEGGAPSHGGIAFQAQRADLDSGHDNYELEPRNTDIYEFQVSDGAVKALTSHNGRDGHIIWYRAAWRMPSFPAQKG